MPLTALLPLLAQAASPALAAPPPLEQDQLSLCLEQARTDPSSAIVNASVWVGESSGPERAFPHQCLGIAYTRLLRWEAAERAFLAAREASLPADFSLRAKFAAMAGNSALADGRHETALADFALASEDAVKGSNTILAGEVEIDRSRALVALGREVAAAEALARARRDAPQNSEGWLLSATLSRRNGALEDAQAQILTAAGLDPQNPAIGLEAGVIAVLSGREEAARQSWQSVLALAPGSPEAETAQAYLEQIGGQAGAEEGTGR